MAFPTKKEPWVVSRSCTNGMNEIGGLWGTVQGEQDCTCQGEQCILFSLLASDR